MHFASYTVAKFRICHFLSVLSSASLKTVSDKKMSLQHQEIFWQLTSVSFVSYDLHTRLILQVSRFLCHAVCITVRVRTRNIAIAISDQNVGRTYFQTKITEMTSQVDHGHWW